MKKLIFFAFVCVLLTVACNTSQPETPSDVASDAISLQKNLPGDSALYGLACDGCTDSVLVFLPYSGGDPDTIDIINARQQHRVWGRLHIGDALSVMINPENPGEALSIINLSVLEGQWCYMVEPTLRTIDGKTPPLPDSIKKKILVPEEYSIKLKADNTASTIGNMRQLGKHGMGQSLAVYPDIHRYTEWYSFNGHLILHADTISGFTKDGDEPVTDTAEIVMLMRDSLILRIGNNEQSYYRKRKVKNDK